MLRILARIIVILLVVAGAAAAAGWLLVRGSLPRYDGQVISPALSAPVTVERDALGTVTVRAANRRDLTWTLGYVHAQERFFEMDLLRRRAAGELAELFGDVALPADRIARAHRMRARATTAVAALSPEDRDVLVAYRDGVNAGLAALSVRPFPYLLTRTAPTPWRDEDTPLVVAAMAFTLNDAENKRELAFAQLHASLSEQAYRFLTASGGSWDAPIAGPALDWPKTPSSADIDLRTLDRSLLQGAGRERKEHARKQQLRRVRPARRWRGARRQRHASRSSRARSLVSCACDLSESAPRGKDGGRDRRLAARHAGDHCRQQPADCMGLHQQLRRQRRLGARRARSRTSPIDIARRTAIA